jgi:hypothetical protein
MVFLNINLGRGVASRMETIRINELDNDKAKEFLMSNKIPKDISQDIVLFTGGLFKYLTLAVEEYQNHKNLKIIQNKIQNKLEYDLDSAISITSEEPVLKGIQILLNSKLNTLSKKEFQYQVFGKNNDKNKEEFKKLMKTNVFSLNNSNVTFQNRAMLNYLKSKK